MYPTGTRYATRLTLGEGKRLGHPSPRDRLAPLGVPSHESCFLSRSAVSPRAPGRSVSRARSLGRSFPPLFFIVSVEFLPLSFVPTERTRRRRSRRAGSNP